MFGSAVLIEYRNGLLLEITASNESENALESESEKEFEQDDENKKIIQLHAYYLPVYAEKSFYNLEESITDFFEKIKLPPPKRS